MVDTIGNVSATPTSAENSSVSQEEFIKLFLAQLQFQDPLEPLNNREFLAQLAQFSVLEQTRQSNESLLTLTSLSSSDQAVSLLNKEVDVTQSSGETFTGTVDGIHFNTTGVSLTIKNASDEFIDGISMNQIRIVK